MADGDENVTNPLDVAVLTPRLFRAIVGPDVALDDVPITRPQAVAMIADAASEAILQTRGTFGLTLIPTHRDETFMAPDQWAFSVEPNDTQQVVIVTQAAISYLYRQLATGLTSEEISDEGQTWRYQLSSTLQKDWLNYLKSQRDAALGAMRDSGVVVDSYISTIAVRDSAASASVEAWVSQS